ncbi:hypothetical protein C8F01DRAFT_274880 [Mycena amicta]|nr:hypothetical protein C8F01DRAFT_274880 [Mycena amicta]
MSALNVVQDLAATQPPPITPTPPAVAFFPAVMPESLHFSLSPPPNPEFLDDVGGYDADFEEFVTQRQGNPQGPSGKGKGRALTPPPSPPPQGPAILAAEGSISAPPAPASSVLCATAPTRIKDLHAQVRASLAIEQARTKLLETRIDTVQGDISQGIAGILAPPSIVGVQTDVRALTDASNAHGRNSTFTNDRISGLSLRLDQLETKLATSEARAISAEALATEAMAQNRQLWAFVQGAPAVPPSHYEPPVMSAPDSVLNANGKRPRFDELGNDNASAGPSNGYAGVPPFTPAAFTPAAPTIIQPPLQWQVPTAAVPTMTAAPSHTVMGSTTTLPTMLTTSALPTMAPLPLPRTKVDVFVGPASWPDGNHDQRDWRTTVSKIVLDVYPGRKIDGQYAVHKSAQHPNYIILKFNSIPDADKFISGWANSPQRLAKYALVGAGRHLN